MTLPRGGSTIASSDVTDADAPVATEVHARPRLVLGSGSPRRRELLAVLGILPDAVLPPDIDALKHDRPDVGAVLPVPRATDKPADYFGTLVAYYDEEISGEAWYAALADLFDGDRAAKLRLLAEVERHTAEIVRPLIEKHGLEAGDRAALQAEGRAAAARWADDWDGLLAYMIRTFPAYVADFERLERMGPPADRPALRRMTEHEEVAIAFLEREAEGRADSIVPLQAFLAVPAATWAA